jgi:hypothetical protein
MTDLAAALFRYQYDTPLPDLAPTTFRFGIIVSDMLPMMN